MTTVTPLRRLYEPTDGRLAEVRGSFAQRADAHGDVDVAYRLKDSPIGELLLAATDQGLVRVGFTWSEGDIVGELASSISPRVLKLPSRLDRAALQLDEYFDGSRTTFDLALDWRLTQGFRRTVLTRLAETDYGSTLSYGELAEQAGNPRAARAAGSACGSNPLPVVVPCHRVVRSDGSLGQYAGGVDAKRLLLNLEGAAIARMERFRDVLDDQDQGGGE